jgi:hypothetical protein
MLSGCCGTQRYPPVKSSVLVLMLGTAPAPAGSYSVVVTGISGGITHNATVSITMQ